jgi:hypothetical protein
MNRDGVLDIRDLRQALADEARLAPGSAGVIEAAQVRARFLRRRKMVAGTAVVVTTALALVSAGLLVPDTRHQLTEQPDEQHGPRGPLQLTVSLPPESGYSAVYRGVKGSTQSFVVEAEQPREGDAGAQVVVHDPGTYDAEPLRRGEPIAVQGRPGYYVPDLDLSLSGYPGYEAAPRILVPAAAWQDASGAWVIVIGGKGSMERPGILRVAEDLRLGPPRDLLAPFHLNYVPDGLGPVEVSSKGSTMPSYTATRNFILGLNSGDPKTREVWIGAEARDENGTKGVPAPRGEGPTVIGGHETWYTESAESSSVQLDVGACLYTFGTLGTDRLPRAELNRMVENAQLQDCSKRDEDTWTKPLP